MGAFQSALRHAISHAFPSEDPGTGDSSFTSDDRAVLTALSESVASLTAALDDINARIIAGVVTVQSPVSASGTAITIVRGDDYSAIEGRSLEFTGPAWPVLDGTVSFKMGPALSVSVSATITGAKTVRVELEPQHTTGLLPKQYSWELQAIQANGHKITLVYGTLTLLADL